MTIITTNSFRPSISGTTMKNKQGFAHILIIFAVLVVGVLAVMFIVPRSINKPTEEISTTTPTSSLIPVDMRGWATYTSSVNNFSFKYPSSNELIKDTPNDVIIGSKSIALIEIFTAYKVNFDALEKCPAEGGKLPCLSDATQVENIMIDNKKARSFYIDKASADPFLTKYHIVQILEPKLEVDMYLGGSAGIDRIFNQILSSFRFTK